MPSLQRAKIALPVETLSEVYERLLARYGPQNWWPPSTLLPVTPFEIIVGAILTQGTGWRNVERALGNLAAAGSLNPAALHNTPLPTLRELIRVSGYYNAKARKLQAFTSLLFDHYGGDLDRLFILPTTELRATLLGVWGIGPETADDIILYAAGQPIFVADSYTRRIFSRLELCPPDAPYDEVQHLFADLPPATELYGEFHAQIDTHGNRTCRPRPRCLGCPLLDICPTGSRLLAGERVSGTVLDLAARA